LAGYQGLSWVNWEGRLLLVFNWRLGRSDIFRFLFLIACKVLVVYFIIDADLALGSHLVKIISDHFFWEMYFA
jgi:hypothetical protein